MTDLRARGKQTDDRGTVDSTRRIFLAGGAVALGGLIGAAGASPAMALPAGAVFADSGRKKRLTVTEGPISPLDAEFNWDDSPGADNTHAVQAAIDKAMTAPGGEVSLPAGEIRVTGLAVDYRSFPVQPENGLPYGYAGPKITGAGMRQTKIIQIEGSTRDIFTVSGQTGEAAGPANNNKATGVVLADFEMTGTPSGGHGLYLRSLVNCEFRNLWIQRTGKSGIYRERATFVSGVDDEYSYANSWNKIKIVAPGGWGVEDSGKASIGGSMTNVEAISPGAGGFLLAPTNMTLLDCQAIGGSVGLRSIRNENRRSINSGLTLINFRSEGSRDGWEVLIEAGTSHMIINPNFFPTSGANCLGVGMLNGGADFEVRNLTVLGGFYGLSLSRFPDQKAIVLGNDSRSTRLINPFIERGAQGLDESALIVDGGRLTSFDLGRTRVERAAGYTTVARAPQTIPTPAAGEINEGWERSGDTWQKVAVFPDGHRVVIAS
jgi:hypothetical protein